MHGNVLLLNGFVYIPSEFRIHCAPLAYNSCLSIVTIVNLSPLDFPVAAKTCFLVCSFSPFPVLSVSSHLFIFPGSILGSFPDTSKRINFLFRYVQSAGNRSCSFFLPPLPHPCPLIRSPQYFYDDELTPLERPCLLASSLARQAGSKP